VQTIRDGFLQTVSDTDRERLLSHHTHDNNLFIWNGEVAGKRMNWNTIGWIFPFHTNDEMERAYELVTRAALAQKSWAGIRQFILSCRFKFQETPIHIPTNLVKVRVKGPRCCAAMRFLGQSPPNLRYITKTVANQLPASNYFRKRTKVQIVIGEERLEPYTRNPKPQRSML
jgi:hypothetical protein